MEILDNLHAFLWSNPTANNCNTYFIYGEKKILIDPGHYHLFGHIRDSLAELSLSPEDMDLVIITHGHPDHMESVKSFVNTQALIAVSSMEMEFIKMVAPHYGEALGISNFEPDILLQEGDLNIGDLTFQVIHSPGHSPGSICLYWEGEKALITGDVVFAQGIGRTDLPSGDGQKLKHSIKRLESLGAEILLPGHGDIVSGGERVKANFEDIESMWFGYI